MEVLRAIWSFYRLYDNFVILDVFVLEPEKRRTFLAPQYVFFLINKKRFQFDQVFQLSQTLQNEIFFFFFFEKFFIFYVGTSKVLVKDIKTKSNDYSQNLLELNANS